MFRNINLAVLLYVIPVILISLSFHEAAHAFVSYKLGDPTAKRLGRLTLNPLKHLDPLGTIMMILSVQSGMGFGWAKPVPINPTYYRNYKRGTMLTSLAGPLSNLLLAFVSVFPYILLSIRYYDIELAEFSKEMILINLSWLFFSVNINLAIFNLLPVPHLDGSKILSGILPGKQYFQLMQYERYIGLAFIAILMFFPNQFSSILRWVSDPVRWALESAAVFIISIFI